ncbi:MAG TPA: threonine ammonia-lyase [Solirubrobacterales bacterium]
MEAVDIEAIERAARTVAGPARRTPVLEPRGLAERLGGRVALKAECLQATGSFKVRGAFAALAALGDDELAAGVVAASAGNHAQGVAAAAREAGAPADIFMPAEAPLAKVDAVRELGARVELVPGGFAEAEAAAERFARERGAALVPPFDHPAVIAGQGTIGLEIADQVPDARLVLVPVGGGALAAGTAIAVKSRLPGVRVVGVRAQNLESSGARRTICDGIAVKRLGRITGPLVEEWVDELVEVSDDEVAEAMVLLLERAKLVVEGAGAVGVAALLSARVAPAAEGATCVVVSGGNVDPTRLAECIAMGETAAGRRLVVSVVMPDRPGALARLLATVAERGANVVDVEHVREGLDLHVGETGITLVLQTRGREHSAELERAIAEAGFVRRPAALPSSVVNPSER